MSVNFHIFYKLIWLVIKVKRLFTLLCVVLTLFFASCSEVVSTPIDEIRLNSWHLKTDYGSNISLSFNDDISEFKVITNNNEANVTVKGLCVIDDEHIVIFDQTDNQTYIFSYKLSGNQLILGYENGEIVLQRN